MRAILHIMQAVVLITGFIFMGACSTVPRSFHPIEPISPGQFSYQELDTALKVHVKDGVVSYISIAQDDRFQVHIQQLDRVDPLQLPTRLDRLAFWINAYNAFAIQGILDGYSPMTLWGRYRYFIARECRVGGQTINLYDLEQKVLIPDFQDPRIHFAIVCASKSCPKLRSEVFIADALDDQLDESARAFINDPTRNRFDRERRVAHLSMIFKWFERDFAAQAGSLIHYLRKYVADPVLANDLERQPYRVEFLECDWSLNGISRVDQS
ncbi:MAG: DUF547 domain-containing protein [Nitrospiraceae bacterium]